MLNKDIKELQIPLSIRGAKNKDKKIKITKRVMCREGDVYAALHLLIEYRKVFQIDRRLIESDQVKGSQKTLNKRNLSPTLLNWHK